LHVRFNTHRFFSRGERKEQGTQSLLHLYSSTIPSSASSARTRFITRVFSAFLSQKTSQSGGIEWGWANITKATLPWGFGVMHSWGKSDMVVSFFKLDPLFASILQNMIILKMALTAYKSFQPKDRKQWRQWLQKNHSSSPGVWLIYFKKSSSRTNLDYNDAVEEALCFGWIDSTRRSVDAERFEQRFTPRKPKSVWSGPNKERIKKVMEKGLMTPAGLAKIEVAKSNGSWEVLEKIYAAADQLEIPEDLDKAFAKNRKARANFFAFPVFARRQFMHWINKAKRPETRKARIRQTVLMAAANKKPGVKGFQL
jgi:uncharacterized protein YdeI (YjbR/CyaY-like superfamily)